MAVTRQVRRRQSGDGSETNRERVQREAQELALKAEAEREATGVRARNVVSAAKTVAAFEGVLHRKIALRHGPLRAAPDAVIAPYDDPWMYTLVEHALAHIVFGSDGDAGNAFCEKYADTLAQAMQTRRTGVPKAAIVRILEAVVGLLDSERVNSLWGVHYPGSAATYERRLASDLGDVDEPFLAGDMVYALRVAHARGSVSLLHKSMTIAEEALARVRGRSYARVLETARWYLKQVVQLHGAFEEPTTGDRMDQDARLETLCNLVGQVSAKTLPPRIVEPATDRMEQERAEAQKMALDILHGTDVEEVEAKQEAEIERMHDVMRSFHQRERSQQDVLRDLVGEPLVFVVPKKNEAPTLSVEDRQTAAHLHTLFVREMGRRRARLSESGTTLDLQAYLQAKISGEYGPVFVDDAPSRGFFAALLLDRSDSMRGQKLVTASRAGAILGRALDFPFVDLEAIGYSSEPGTVHLYDFDPLEHSFEAGGAKGGTPTHVALRYARLKLGTRRGACHAFLVTDGEPNHATKTGAAMSEEQVYAIVRKEVEALLRRGVRLSVLLIDPSVGKPAITDKEADTMFGPHVPRRRAIPGTLCEAMIDLVSTSFLRYLKNG